jgi:DNA-binding transcriptional LysR family regulator
MCADQVRDGRLVPILCDWTLPRGGLYFVTPSARTRPAKVEALSAFFIKHLGAPSWRLVD